MDNNSFKKVTIFTTRCKMNQNELLIIEHPTAGLQLPAGSVEANELPLDAAKRELFEETNIKNYELINLLGSQKTILPSSTGIIFQTSKLQSEPRPNSPFHNQIKRGYKINILSEKNDYSFVRYNEFNYNKNPVELIYTIEGWVPKVNIVNSIVRYFYRFVTCDIDQDSWYKVVDGHCWKLKWHSLPLKLSLIGQQQEWLDEYYNRLI